jgi:hypothetical protein
LTHHVHSITARFTACSMHRDRREGSFGTTSDFQYSPPIFKTENRVWSRFPSAYECGHCHSPHSKLNSARNSRPCSARPVCLEHTDRPLNAGLPAGSGAGFERSTQRPLTYPIPTNPSPRPQTPDPRPQTRWFLRNPSASQLLNMANEKRIEDMEAPREQAALERIQTAQSVNISAELFEKLYLNPPNKVSGDLRRTFANPTPLCVVSFSSGLTFRLWSAKAVKLTTRCTDRSSGSSSLSALWPRL